MFRHRGNKRTFRHNLQIASLLSFVAGIVNVTAFFFVQRLTTNVTGHFAFFADEVAKNNLNVAIVYLLYILSFFLGAFMSNALVELVSLRNIRYSNMIPITLEIIILSGIALWGPVIVVKSADLVACCLLFAMGLQNALVTKISNSVVRTTHLTGLFTDLGIELSQLFFWKKKEQLKKLRSSIQLRLAIISFFFLGCIAGGTLYALYGIPALLLAALCLGGGLIFDQLKMRVLSIRRSYLRRYVKKR